MPTNEEYLANVSLFKDLGRKKLAELAEMCTRTKLGQGAILFLEGDLGSSLYIIVKGKIRIEKTSESGEMQVVGVRGVGEAIGEMSLIDGAPRSAQAVGLVPCNLLVLNKREFDTMLLKDPSICHVLLKSLAARIRESDNSLVRMRSSKVEERLLQHLKGLANADKCVVVQSTQAELADIVGCTREAVNRGFKSLLEQGHIKKTASRTYTIY